MLIVTPNDPTQMAYIAPEVFLAGTRTPDFSQFENAKFLMVMDNEDHTVRSTWEKVHGNFLRSRHPAESRHQGACGKPRSERPQISSRHVMGAHHAVLTAF